MTDRTAQPGYANQRSDARRGRSLRQRINASRAGLFLLIFVSAVSGIALYWHFAMPQVPSVWWPVALELALCAASLGLLYLLYRHKRRLEQELARYELECSRDPARWPPTTPVQLRRNALALETEVKAARESLESARDKGGYWVIGIILSLVAAGFAVVATEPGGPRVAWIAGCLLVAALQLWPAVIRLKALPVRQQRLALLEAELSAVLRKLARITSAYEHEQRLEALARQHGVTPYVAPREEPCHGTGAVGAVDWGDEDEDWTEDDDWEDEDEWADDDEAEAYRDGARRTATPPPDTLVKHWTIGNTAWVTANQAPQPQRVKLEAAAGACFHAAFKLTHIGHVAAPLALIWVPIALVLCAIGGWKQLLAHLLPATVAVPRPAPDWLKSPAPGLAFAADESDDAADGDAEAALSPGAAALRDDLLRREMQELDQRLVKRSLAQIGLVYPSLLIAGLLLKGYINDPQVPANLALASSGMWFMLALPLLGRIWRGSTQLYWRRAQLQIELQTTELWRRLESDEIHWHAWQRTARNRLRLLWLACAALYSTLALGTYWRLGVFHSAQPLPESHWVLLSLSLVAVTGGLAYAYAQAGTQLRRWRGRWLALIKEVQQWQYMDVLHQHLQATARREHGAHHARISPPEFDEAAMTQYVEQDFAGMFRRDPLEYWLERLRSAAGAVFLCFILLHVPLVHQSQYDAITAFTLPTFLVLLLLVLLLWSAWLWRLYILRKQAQPAA